MKKTLATFFVIIGSIFINASFASAGFLDDDGDLDLYKKIDDGSYKLELRMTTMELKGGNTNGSVSDFVNKSLKTDCIKVNEKTVYSDKIEDVLGACLESNGGKISVNEASTYMTKIKNLVKTAENKAKDKVEKIYQISRIGMYSDGNDDNSPFDLISDINNINKIIFSEDIEYNGVNSGDANIGMDAFLNGKLGEDLLSAMGQNPNNGDNGNNGNNNLNQANSGSLDSGAYICKTDESGLNTKELENIKNNYKVSDFNNYNRTNQTNAKITDWIRVNPANNSGDSANGGYSPINDNAMWPCNSFFCITIEFVTSMHNLLGGGKTVSIESIVNRSNNHLKKFTNTSLIQLKIPTNNFQIGWKDLNLGDTFHIGFQVIKKSPPILNIEGGVEKIPKTDIDGKDTKTMLSKYFENMGLDYKRENDLQKFKKQEAELKSIMSSTEMKITESLNKQDEYISLIEKKKDINYNFSKQVGADIINADLNDFGKQFSELGIFSGFLGSYSRGLYTVIDGMNNKTTGSK